MLQEFSSNLNLCFDVMQIDIKILRVCLLYASVQEFSSNLNFCFDVMQIDIKILRVCLLYASGVLLKFEFMF